MEGTEVMRGVTLEAIQDLLERIDSPSRLEPAAASESMLNELPGDRESENELVSGGSRRPRRGQRPPTRAGERDGLREGDAGADEKSSIFAAMRMRTGPRFRAPAQRTDSIPPSSAIARASVPLAA
jgi:hypothetical protein